MVRSVKGKGKKTVLRTQGEELKTGISTTREGMEWKRKGGVHFEACILAAGGSVVSAREQNSEKVELPWTEDTM